MVFEYEWLLNRRNKATQLVQLQREHLTKIVMNYFSKRTLAYLLDCLISYTIVMLVIQLAILSQFRASLGITNEWLANSWNMQLYVLTTISFPIWLYFVYFDSEKSKGTFGKRMMKLSVCDNNEKRLELGKSFLRTFLKLSPWEIIHAGLIFPNPIYFENEPSTRIVVYGGIVLFVVYAVSIIFNTNRRSLYDQLIGSNVISTNV